MAVDPAIDRAIVRLAGAQAGNVTFAQLLEAGLTRSAIRSRVDRGFLQRRHRGVYAVGDPDISPLGAAVGALLAVGGDGVLSHRTAAVIWSIAAESDADPIHVTVARRRIGPFDGVRIHRVQHLDPREAAFSHGLRVTSPARTLVDFAADAGNVELERALAEARVQRIVTDAKLSDALARAGRRKGAAALRALLQAEAGAALTRSEAERRMLRMLRDADLPLPETNVDVLGHQVDMVWREQRVVVEIDGFQFHNHRAAFERDRRRDRELVAAGWRVIRITWRQLLHEPFAVVAHLACALYG
jgi:very-short-patch-repair endonuclease